MSIRSTLAGVATAVILGSAALVGGTIAGATSAEAAPGWHGRGHHGHFGHSFRHPGRHWGHARHFGHRGWGYRPAYFGGCYTVLRPRFIPGFGVVERPVTRCR